MSDASQDMRAKILEAMLKHVPFDGWTSIALRRATADCDLPEGSEELYFPSGPVEAIRFWGDLCDAKADVALAELDQSKMKIREKVTQGVIARLEAIGPHEEAARRALAKLSLPSSGSAGPRSLWAAADTIWRAIGDVSTDVNYYSKRTVLSAVISTSLMSWLSDSSPDKAEARAFLNRRIENVMQFETIKAKARKASVGFPDPVKFMSKLRYGSRRPRGPRR